VKGGKIVDVTGGAGYKCNAIPIELKKKLSVSKAGKFHYSGKVDKVTGDPAGTLVLKGKFKTRKKAAGSYKYVDSDGCTHQAKFTAVLGKSAV
jgi:hypothetical protein